ncbi:hypothetical protein [Comamonas thiooxydans]|uniref:hypothetical protein n=1 Tax=Comamonas thiooxydans TaxID=363952 RepID=UPI00209C200B|nr:hypothetical protein [Comamonas thiooxydans]MCO8250748.1 hypothetical protein [Comamonas thiooxydans]
MRMPTREKLGKKLPSQEVTGADIVALISRVNFKSVHKVFAAIQAVANHTGLSAQQIVDLASVPAAPPAFDGSDNDRTDATEVLACRMAQDIHLGELGGFLYLRPRFADRKYD